MGQSNQVVERKMTSNLLKKAESVSAEQILGEGRRGQVLIRWRSSLWKLLWLEYLIYVVAFIIVSMIYRFALPAEAQNSFELLIRYIRTKSRPASHILTRLLCVPR